MKYNIINKKNDTIEAVLDDSLIENIQEQTGITDLFTLCILCIKNYNLAEQKKLYTYDKIIIHVTEEEYKNIVVDSFFNLITLINNHAADGKIIEYVDTFNNKFNSIAEITKEDVLEYHVAYYEANENCKYDEVMRKTLCFTTNKIYKFEIEGNTYNLYTLKNESFTISDVINNLYTKLYKIEEETNYNFLDSTFKDAYSDCKLVLDSITDAESFQTADAGLVLSHLNTIVKALKIQAAKE